MDGVGVDGAYACAHSSHEACPSAGPELTLRELCRMCWRVWTEGLCVERKSRKWCRRGRLRKRQPRAA
eukprot:3937144-Rhodomonas_salina.1